MPQTESVKPKMSVPSSATPKVTPPENYVLAKTLVYTRENPNFLWVNILMALMLLFFYSVFSNITVALVPGFDGAWLGGFSGWGVLGVFVMAFVMMFLHEFLHYLGMWLITGVRPKFGTKGLNPRAILEGVYFPPLVYAAMKLTPLVVLTGLYFFLAPLFPLTWLDYVLFFFAGNAAYAAQDLLTVVQVFRERGKKLIEDRSEYVYIYTEK